MKSWARAIAVWTKRLRRRMGGAVLSSSGTSFSTPCREASTRFDTARPRGRLACPIVPSGVVFRCDCAAVVERSEGFLAWEAGMEAGIRTEGPHTRRGRGEDGTGAGRRGAGTVAAARGEGIPPSLTGLRVALVHDWLTGMRGGEKCLEVLCRAFPGATLYTLIHRRGSLSPAIEAMEIRTSVLQKIPGVFRWYRHMLPVMPLAAKGWRLKDVDLVISLSHCVAKAVVPPPGVPHVCYCFTPMRYAWQGRDAYLESWSDRPLRRLVARRLLARLKRWDRATANRVSHFVAISETVRGRIAQCYRRDSRVIQPPVDVEFYTPAGDARARSDAYLVVSALVPYKRIDQAVAACTKLGRQADRDRRGPGARAARGDGRELRAVSRLAGRRCHSRALPAVPGALVPG